MWVEFAWRWGLWWGLGGVRPVAAVWFVVGRQSSVQKRGLFAEESEREQEKSPAGKGGQGAAKLGGLAAQSSQRRRMKPDHCSRDATPTWGQMPLMGASPRAGLSPRRRQRQPAGEYSRTANSPATVSRAVAPSLRAGQ